MLKAALSVLGIDVQQQVASLKAQADQQVANIKAQAEELKSNAISEARHEASELGVTAGFALGGGILALLALLMGLTLLFLWIHVQRGPFVALTVVGVITGLLAAILFGMASSRKPQRTPRLSPIVSSPPIQPAAPLPVPAPSPVNYAAAIPPLRENASILDTIAHRVTTRAASASEETVDAAADILRTGSRTAIVGTLIAAAAIGIFIGRRQT